MKYRIATAIVLLLSLGCSGQQTAPYGEHSYASTDASSIIIYMSEPDRAFDRIGAVSVKQYKPGFGDPTIVDAHNRLKEAGAELGADAVIVTSSRSTGERIIVVEGEAIRFSN